MAQPALDIPSSSHYSELNDPALITQFTQANGELSIPFYVEGIHCVACLWVLEQLPTLLQSVQSSRLNMGTAILTVTATPDIRISDIALTISRMGYRPRLLSTPSDAGHLKIAENRRELIRVGIAFALNGNIMLMTVPLYGGAGGHWAALFSILSALFCTVIVTYCALPFYRSAWGAFRHRRLNIDTPIAIAIIGGFLISLLEVSHGSSVIYFDSIGMLTALLLGSRYLLRVIHQTTSDATRSVWNGLPSRATKIESNGDRISVRTETIQVGDIIEVGIESVIPIDGTLVDGNSHVNMAIITGESFPQKIKIGAHVTAGTFNIDGPLQIKTRLTGQDTRVGQLLKRLSELPPPAVTQTTDRIARRLLAAVLGISAALLMWGLVVDHPMEGLTRALSLLIVTCPCALGIAVPLTVAVTISRAAQRGIIVQNPDTFDAINSVETIFLDKTGTLTEGQLDVVSVDCDLPEHHRDIAHSVAAALESVSMHPVGLAIRRYYQIHPPGHHVDLMPIEIPGCGVQAQYDGHHWRLKRAQSFRDGASETNPSTTVSLYRDGIEMVTFGLGDKLRTESRDVVTQLNKTHQVHILSGDSQNAVSKIAQSMGIDAKNWTAEMSPEEKLAKIQSSSTCMMVGDGANDALALKAATVGVSVFGSLETSLKSADVALLTPGITPLLTLVELGRDNQRVMNRNFRISIAYNLVFGVLSVTGHMTPLLAAIVMPISSLTVILSSILRKKKEAK